MMKKTLSVFLFILFSFSNYYSQDVKIYDIQGAGDISSYQYQVVNTEGVVTLCLFGENQLNGFFIQDTAGDNDSSTSDGIFVYGYQDVQQGDYISFEGKVSEYYGKTELKNINNLQILSSGNDIPYTYLNFPQDFLEESDYERFEGMAICFEQTVHQVSNSDLDYSGTLAFSSKRLRAPTDIALPLSADYDETLESNAIDIFFVDDASNDNYPSPIPFLDSEGTRRNGEKVDNIKLVLDYNNSRWLFYPTETMIFYGNPRTESPEEPLSNYDLKICSFNLENFLNESSLQKIRIVKTLKAIDADIFGLCEVKQGQEYIEALVNSLNNSLASNEYSYIDLGLSSSDYISTQIIYKSSKVSPISDFDIINSVGPYNRKIAQGFSVNNSDFSFIISANHLKAKSGSGTGEDADQNDGQSGYNYTRTLESQAIVERLEYLKTYYDIENVLVLGDLNSLNFEDPIEVFRDSGYENQVARFDSTQYSYCFENNVQYLDYILANDAIYPYILFATNWHINADEPAFLDWDKCDNSQDFLYRSSDHDPAIVYLNLISNKEAIDNIETVNVFPNPVTDKLSYSSEKEVNKINFYSIEGNLIKTEILNSSAETINVEFLPTGVFYIEFIADNNIFVKKIIKIK